MSRPALLALLAVAAGCIRPAEDRAELDREVGLASGGDVDFEVVEGMAHVRRAEDGALSLWAQSPAFRLEAIAGSAPASPWTLEIDNCMPDASASAIDAAGTPLEVTELERPRPTLCRFELDIPPSSDVTIDVGPPDAGDVEPYVFVAMADIQTALPRVDQMFDRINQDPEVRFVVSMGDLVETARPAEYELLQEKLPVLDVPYFSTIGNHELNGDPMLWHDAFGRYNIHFDFKGVAFSFVDSGSASLDPIVYSELDGWLADARDRIHIFGTHYPALDPIGVRSGSFRSRNEAAKLLGRLAAGRVDLTLYGHIHSYYAYRNAGIPAFISGGGGALPEKLDGIGRHYLRVEVDPQRGEVTAVGLVRID